jgi:SAM-dependent methyltransferase
MIDYWRALPRYSMRKYLVLHIIKKFVHRSKSCLEIGYGSGDLLIDLSKIGLKTYGYDFSSEAFEMARKNIKKCKDEIKNKILLLTAENQISHNRYDFVIALEVLEHEENDTCFLIKLRKYLTKEGTLIFSVPAHKSKWGNNDVWAGHYRRYEKKELYEKLLSNGFDDVQIWSYGYPLILLLDLFIHQNRRKEIDFPTNIGKEGLTKRSGIERKNTFVNLLASWKIWIFPFFYIQRLFLKFDCSSAFLIIARRKE